MSEFKLIGFNDNERVLLFPEGGGGPMHILRERLVPGRLKTDAPRWVTQHRVNFDIFTENYPLDPPNYLRAHWDWSNGQFDVGDVTKGFILFRAWGNFTNPVGEVTPYATKWHEHGIYLWETDDGVPGNGRWEPIPENNEDLRDRALDAAAAAQFTQQHPHNLTHFPALFWREVQASIMDPKDPAYSVHGAPKST